jgi:predicted MFS family arabinose efflux permease
LVAKEVQGMSTLLFGVLLMIGLVWGVPFVASRLFGERAGRRVEIGLFLGLSVLLLTTVWLIYFAEHDTQWAVIDAVFGVWGWAAGPFKLVVGFLMIRFARSKSVSGERRVWHHPVEWLGYVLMALGCWGYSASCFGHS